MECPVCRTESALQECGELPKWHEAEVGAPIGRLVPLVIADRIALLVTLTLTMEHLAEECRSAPLLAAVHDVEL